jgi:hypothetical protein
MEHKFDQNLSISSRTDGQELPHTLCVINNVHMLIIITPTNLCTGQNTL